MAAVTSTKTIINWMFDTSFDSLPTDVRELARLAVYDGIGSNLACSLLAVAHSMYAFTNRVGGPPDCTMIGFPNRTSVLNAAQLNGMLGHADEVDAIEGDGVGAHVLAANLAAAVTAGQMAQASGQEVLRGVVLGYELTKRTHAVATALSAETATTAGPAATLVDAGNTMGATAAAGIALGLTAEQMEKALGLAAALASGITPFAREEGHMLKSFVRGGVGARNGVAAAIMGQVGYDAPEDIFDGSQGFFHSRLGVQDPHPAFTDGLGTDFGLRSIVMKRVSAGGPNQAPRQALTELMAENGLTAADIAAVEVQVAPTGYSTITNVHHPSIEGRDVLAMAAVYGGTGFKEAHNEKYNLSPEAVAMKDRISISPKEEWANRDRFQAVVVITTNDGRRFERESVYRRMNASDVDDKFADLVGMRAGAARASELADALRNLESAGNVDQVMALCELPAAHIEDF